MKRSLSSKVALFVLAISGGAIINVAVARGCATWLPEKSDGWTSMRSGAVRLDNGMTWGAHTRPTRLFQDRFPCEWPRLTVGLSLRSKSAMACGHGAVVQRTPCLDCV